MAEEQDNMTPEEKLLNVIQNGDEETVAPEAKPAAEAPAAAAPAAAPAEAAPAEGKPALKLAKKEADASPEPESDTAEPAEAAEQAPAAASTDSAPSVVSSKKKGGDGSGIKIINRMLAAGVIIMLGLSCFEVFTVIRARGAIRPPSMLEIPQQQDVTVSALEVKEAYAKDAFWRQPDAAGGVGSQTTTTTITVSTTPWAEELKSFKLMGTSMKEPKSDSEAILLDSRDNKMYFVRLGNSFPLLDGNVRLDDIETGRARFTDGSASVELK